MEHAMDINSEEELLQLRDEGKISEAEYNDLLAAIRKPPPENVEEFPTAADDARTKRKQGRIAFVLMLVGIIVPAVLYWLSEMAAQAHDANTHAAIGPWFFLGVAFEIAAFVLGVIAWPNVYGKVTVITISALTVLSLLFTA
jgi:hypothetical protein